MVQSVVQLVLTEIKIIKIEIRVSLSYIANKNLFMLFYFHLKIIYCCMKEFNRAIRVFCNITLIISSILHLNVLRDISTSQLSTPGFGLQTTCIVTFCVMFLPRSRQLTAMGNGGVYLEDQEDQLSLHHDQEELTYNQVSLLERV